jgi:hypothetical protein
MMTKIPLKQKTGKSLFRNKSTYFLVNAAVLLVLIVLFAWIAFIPADVKCVYAAKGLSCPTCGLTRAFRTVLSFDFANVHLQRSVFQITFFFVIQLIWRAIVFLMYFRREPSKWFIGADVLFSIALFILVFGRLFFHHIFRQAQDLVT